VGSRNGTHDHWYLVLVTKATGSAIPQWHVYDYNGSSWDALRRRRCDCELQPIRGGDDRPSGR
jgi:hypothetical protein